MLNFKLVNLVVELSNLNSYKVFEILFIALSVIKVSLKFVLWIDILASPEINNSTTSFYFKLNNSIKAGANLFNKIYYIFSFFAATFMLISSKLKRVSLH